MVFFFFVSYHLLSSHSSFLSHFWSYLNPRVKYSSSLLSSLPTNSFVPCIFITKILYQPFLPSSTRVGLRLYPATQYTSKHGPGRYAHPYTKHQARFWCHVLSTIVIRLYSTPITSSKGWIFKQTHIQNTSHDLLAFFFVNCLHQVVHTTQHMIKKGEPARNVYCITCTRYMTPGTKHRCHFVCQLLVSGYIYTRHDQERPCNRRMPYLVYNTRHNLLSIIVVTYHINSGIQHIIKRSHLWQTYLYTRCILLYIPGTVLMPFRVKLLVSIRLFIQ